MKYYWIYGMACFFLLWACSKRDRVPLPNQPYVLNLPTHFPAPNYNFEQNPLTVAGVQLGRMLFYEPMLSKDSSVSCGFCHQPFAAFAHFDHPLSHGIENRTGTRTVPTLFNLIWQQSFMWDGGVNHLDIQPLTPLTDPNEMGNDLQTVLARLKAHPQYPSLFEQAFGTREINTQRLFHAFSQFMATLNSHTSKYDSVKNQFGNAHFSYEEEQGYQIFLQKCNSCHTEPLFTDGSYRNNGLPVDPFLKDVGRMQITQQAADSLKFKVPSLRNVLYSAPYMHDGRFYDIFNVLDHYDGRYVESSTLDPQLLRGMHLTSTEKRHLYFFLNTLSDPSFISNPQFQERP